MEKFDQYKQVPNDGQETFNLPKSWIERAKHYALLFGYVRMKNGKMSPERAPLYRDVLRYVFSNPDAFQKWRMEFYSERAKRILEEQTE